MAGNLIGIADAMRDSPEMTGDTYTASPTRRAVDLPYMAGSITGIADATRDSPRKWQLNCYTRSVTRMTRCQPAIYGT
jgi:hypothetical protein